MVSTRPKLTLGAGHMTQPFYSASDVMVALTFSISDIIDALTIKALVSLYSGPIGILHTLIMDYSVGSMCTKK